MTSNESHRRHPEASTAMHSSVPKVYDGDVKQGDSPVVQNASSHHADEARLESAGAAAAETSVATTTRHSVGGIEIVIEQRSERGIGWMLWDASQHLVDYIASDPALVAHRSVVELGSGCGLCGMAAAALGASSVTLTDSAPVMPCLQDSVDRNRACLMGSCDDISCQVLDWTADNASDFSSNRVHMQRSSRAANNDASSPQPDDDAQQPALQPEVGRDNISSTACGSRPLPDNHQALSSSISYEQAPQYPPDVILVSDCTYWKHLFRPLYRTLLLVAGHETTILLAHKYRREQVEAEAFEILGTAFCSRVLHTGLSQDGATVEILELRLRPGTVLEDARRDAVDAMRAEAEDPIALLARLDAIEEDMSSIEMA